MARSVARLAAPLVLAALMAALGVPARAARAEETTAQEAEEPELEGEALAKHSQEVQELLDFLLDPKNQALMEERIRDVGARKSRAAREALIRFCIGRKSKRHVQLAFGEIARIGGAGAVAFLCGRDALRSREVLLQVFAADALATTRDARAADDLLAVLKDRRTKIEPMAAAARAVAQIAPTDEQVIATLLDVADHKKDEVRGAAVEALGYLGADAARARLRVALEEDRNANVRAAAARGYGHTGDADAIPVLEAVIQKDKSNEVREACLAAIATLRGG